MDDGKIKEAHDTVLKLDAIVARLDPRQEDFATVSGEVARDLEALATHLRDGTTHLHFMADIQLLCASPSAKQISVNC